MARNRTTNWEPDQTSVKNFSSHMKDELMQTLLRLPEKDLRELMKSKTPDASEEEIDTAVAYARARVESDPFTLLQPFEQGSGGQLKISKGFNLESALYISSLTGSIIYTDVRPHWDMLHKHTSARESPSVPHDLLSSAETLSSLGLPIELDPRKMLKSRDIGRFNDMRGAIRQIVAAVNEEKYSLFAEQVQQLAKFLNVNLRLFKTENLAELVEGELEISAPITGFERNEISRLLLIFGASRRVRPPSVAMFLETTP